MPRHNDHRALHRVLLGDAHNEVNKILDWPVVFAGRSHRRYFHDPLSAPLLGAWAAAGAGKDPLGGALAGFLHIGLDGLERNLRRLLPWPLSYLIDQAWGPILDGTLRGQAIRATTAVSQPEAEAPGAVRAEVAEGTRILLRQRPSSWWQTREGRTYSTLVAPALTAIALLSWYGLVWFFFIYQGLLAVGGPMTWVLLALLACGWLGWALWFSRWWTAHRPYEPLGDRDGNAVIRVTGDQTWVKATNGRGDDRWCPVEEFLTPDTLDQMPLPPPWTSQLANLLVVLAAIPVALFAVLLALCWASAGTSRSRRR